jgi:hypothetical protein
VFFLLNGGQDFSQPAVAFAALRAVEFQVIECNKLKSAFFAPAMALKRLAACAKAGIQNNLRHGQVHHSALHKSAISSSEGSKMVSRSLIISSPLASVFAHRLDDLNAGRFF